MSLHLTNVQMDRLLHQPGPLDTDTAAHLGYCEECRAEVDQMERLLGTAGSRHPQGGSFRLATAALAERQWTVAQLRAPKTPVSRSLLHFCLGGCSGVIPNWSIAAALLVLVATLLAPAFWARHAASVEAAREAATPPASAAPLSDDALLRSISQEVATNVPGPLQPLQVASTLNSSDERISR